MSTELHIQNSNIKATACKRMVRGVASALQRWITSMIDRAWSSAYHEQNSPRLNTQSLKLPCFPLHFLGCGYIRVNPALTLAISVARGKTSMFTHQLKPN